MPGIGFRFDIGHDAAWVPDFERSVVRRVELDTGAVLAEIPTGLNPEGISVTDDAVWVANHRAGTVTRIDPTTNEPVATIEVGPAGPSGPQAILASDERVWVGVPNLGQVVVIDAATNAVIANIDSTATCGEMQLLDESVWVTNCFETRRRRCHRCARDRISWSARWWASRHSASDRWRCVAAHDLARRTARTSRAGGSRDGRDPRLRPKRPTCVHHGHRLRLAVEVLLGYGRCRPAPDRRLHSPSWLTRLPEDPTQATHEHHRRCRQIGTTCVAVLAPLDTL